MKKFFLSILVATLLSIGNASAVDNNTVEIVYSGNTATVEVASNISSYVTVQSGNSSHVKIVQDENFAGVDATLNNVYGEITYVLSGSSTDGEFYVEGAFKSTVELSGVTLTNPTGPAINIQNGKRITLSVKKNTVNSIVDGANEEFNGCLHCKGHLKIKGKGVLNVAGNSRHGIYVKEYLEVKNATLNITAAARDAIHCKEYMLMESGTVTISGAQDDGIQVELAGTESTGVKTDHEDEDTGNFYMLDGTLTISGYQGKAIKVDGSISYTGGTQNFDTNDTEIMTSVEKPSFIVNDGATCVYDLNGRRIDNGAMSKKGIYVVKCDGKVSKVVNSASK